MPLSKEGAEKKKNQPQILNLFEMCSHEDAWLDISMACKSFYIEIIGWEYPFESYQGVSRVYSWYGERKSVLIGAGFWESCFLPQWEQ